MPFKSNFFEIIFNLGVMEHFNENQIKNILTEFKRTLTKRRKINIILAAKIRIKRYVFKVCKKKLFF